MSLLPNSFTPRPPGIVPLQQSVPTGFDYDGYSIPSYLHHFLCPLPCSIQRWPSRGAGLSDALRQGPGNIDLSLSASLVALDSPLALLDPIDDTVEVLTYSLTLVQRRRKCQYSVRPQHNYSSLTSRNTVAIVCRMVDVVICVSKLLHSERFVRLESRTSDDGQEIVRRYQKLGEAVCAIEIRSQCVQRSLGHDRRSRKHHDPELAVVLGELV